MEKKCRCTGIPFQIQNLQTENYISAQNHSNSLHSFAYSAIGVEFKGLQECLENATFIIFLRQLEIKKVKLSLCLTNKAICHEDIRESGCIDPCMIDLGTSWR
jgi:hypothetical protein